MDEMVGRPITCNKKHKWPALISSDILGLPIRENIRGFPSTIANFNFTRCGKEASVKGEGGLAINIQPSPRRLKVLCKCFPCPHYGST